MKYYFLINPVSGNGNAPKIVENLMNKADKEGFEYRIIYTEYPHHATSIARGIAENNQKSRIYACGGDGTLFDVVNGVYGYNNVEIGVIPCGSGNDYVKYFGNLEDFLDINGQFTGKSIPVDIIKFQDKYCINIASIGMDAFVVQQKNKMKRLSKINGKLAYLVSVFITFIFNMDTKFKVTIENKDSIEKNLMFVVVSNGRYYGSSFNPTPNALVNDGFIDVMLMNAVKRHKVITLLSKYQKGLHINIKGLCQIIKAKSVRVESEKTIPVNLDGEVFETNDAFFEIAENSMNFILPIDIYNKNYKNVVEEFVLS